MTIWLLTAKKDLTSIIPNSEARKKYGKTFRKGKILEVHLRGNGGEPGQGECVGALLLEGYCKEDAEHYNGGSWKVNFDGYDTKKECSLNIVDAQFDAQLHRKKYSWKEMEKGEEKKSDSNSSVSKSEKSTEKVERSCGEKFKRFIVKLVFTILPVLPLWWLIKLLVFNVGYFLKALGYIVSWPFRCLLSCCVSNKFLPDYDCLPEYWFNWK